MYLVWNISHMSSEVSNWAEGMFKENMVQDWTESLKLTLAVSTQVTSYSSVCEDRNMSCHVLNEGGRQIF